MNGKGIYKWADGNVYESSNDDSNNMLKPILLLTTSLLYNRMVRILHHATQIVRMVFLTTDGVYLIKSRGHVEDTM